MELAWHTIYYGFPCTGVLAIELLKQTKSSNSYRLNLPRSEVVQNLSVFIASINGISPTEPNYKVCMSMQKVLQRILDKVLDHPPTASTFDNTHDQISGTAVNSIPPSLDFSSIMGTMDDPDLTDWLNSVNWSKDPWAEGYWPTM